MSNLSDAINNDLKEAMKAKDSAKLTVLRSLKSAFKNAAIEKGGADYVLEDKEAIPIIRKQIKQREDSIAQFKEGKREDLAEKEAAEIDFLKPYLPAEMDASAISKLVEEVIGELGASSKKDMGKVMKVLQEKTAGTADNKVLSQEVMKRLS